MFVRCDVGNKDRKSGVKGDCQVRALCKASGLSYDKAWQLLYETQGELGECGFALVRSLNEGDSRFGVKQKLSFPAAKGKERMTGLKFCKIYPTGNYILRLAHHVVAVCDGKLYDTWDSSGKCVYNAWEM